MRFATFSTEHGPKVALVGDGDAPAWPVDTLMADIPPDAATDMTAFVRLFEDIAHRMKPNGDGIARRDLKLLAPFPRPARDIICVGKNYRDHAQEFTVSGFDTSASSAAAAIPVDPIVFAKSSGAVIAHGDPILLHPGLDSQMDYEAELAVVIGRAGRAIPRDKALSHVFGYTIVNDVTARDLQARHNQWYIGKSLDGSCPMGPWVVTPDEIDLAAARICCRVNGEMRQSAVIGDLIFDVAVLIETISAGMTLEPGTIIATGTPAGVAIGFDPPRFLRAGDLVEVEIDGIGRLANPVRRLATAEAVISHSTVTEASGPAPVSAGTD